MPSPHDILRFWFEVAGAEKWFAKNDAFDAEIRTRFEHISIELAAEMRMNGRHNWLADKNSALALILVLDQFPRNMYRQTKAAFAWDDLALQAARLAIGKSHDVQTGQDRRAFFYKPFMHAESLAIQDEGVELMEMRLDNPDTLFHARAHRKLIARFGRFPHRNESLGRASTADEISYLKSGAYRP